MTTSTISTLADVDLRGVRCCACGRELPLSSECEPFETGGGLWVIVKCSKCQRNSPFFVEKAYVPDLDS